MKAILFNTEMVKAILDGRKTETRRVIKGLPPGVHRVEPVFNDDGEPISWDFQFGARDDDGGLYEMYKPLKSPCRPGDILCVRETWKMATIDPAGGGYALQDIYLYKADEPIDTTGMLVEPRWHPSIHMPKDAARIFLRVKKVWPERLQEITGRECVKEGIPESSLWESYLWGVGDDITIGQFNDLWDSTIKPKDRDKYGWDSNPWVWVIEFERITKEETVKE